MVDYKEIFKKFYDNSIALKGEINNYNIFLERGLSLCILERCLNSDDIPLGVEISSKKIFNILNIDVDRNNMDINLFKNYVVLKLQSGIKILSLSNPNTPKMTQICSYDGTFVMSPEYSSFEPLEKLANELDIPLYSVESNLLKSKFKDLIDEYIGENLYELMLLGCVDKSNVVNSDFNLNAEMKKIISASYKEDMSIYDYLKENYISSNLSKYIKKYPSIKDNKLSINNLLLKYKKAEWVPHSELLTDNVKNDFKVNIKKSVAQRRELEKFIYKGWLDKPNYDMLLEVNKECTEMISKLNKIVEKNPTNIVLKMDESILFDSNSFVSCEMSTNMMIMPIKLGKYNFKKFTPVIECFDMAGFRSNIIKLENSQDRKRFSVHKDGVQIYPSIHS